MQAGFIYLASASPRRQQLLEQLGLRFEVVPAEVDESRRPGEPPRDYVLRLARHKAETAAARIAAPAPVLAADTAVVLDEVIFGKPRDRAEALAILARLSGRRHQVLSAVALWQPTGISTALSVSHVSFGPISPQQAEVYWETGEPRDKAGAYGIQGRGALFVQQLEGSYSGVMGLPLYETAALLREAGVHVL
jgi:septum formation protein